jgi:enamine deaminase RidA (YjgF/YER057c/UK114 family)
VRTGRLVRACVRADLVQPDLLVEIEATAVVDDDR